MYIDIFAFSFQKNGHSHTSRWDPSVHRSQRQGPSVPYVAVHRNDERCFADGLFVLPTKSGIKNSKRFGFTVPVGRNYVSVAEQQKTVNN